MSELLELRNLSKSFGDKQILKNVNITLKPNRIVGLLGKNGSGKSTIFKLICDLLTPSGGEILVEGKPIGVESKEVVAFLPERTYLEKNSKVADIVEMFADYYSNFDKEKAHKLLKDLDLDAEMNLAKMSKGMKEKVQLVLVMSRKAKLYVLDEPLGGIDPVTRDYILDTILKNFEENATLFISTHMISDIERILDDVRIIDNGQILLQEEADKIREKEKCSIDDVFRRLLNGK